MKRAPPSVQPQTKNVIAHPKNKLKGLTLSSYTKERLAEIQQFQNLIHMDIRKGYDGYARRSGGEGAY